MRIAFHWHFIYILLKTVNYFTFCHLIFFKVFYKLISPDYVIFSSFQKSSQDPDDIQKVHLSPPAGSRGFSDSDMSEFDYDDSFQTGENLVSCYSYFVIVFYNYIWIILIQCCKKKVFHFS